MRTWVKRGLQATLVTGGLLMLGTGIASASENNVNPDTPSSYGDAVAALGANVATDSNQLIAVNGGDATTHGDGSLPAYNYLLPVDVRITAQNTPVGELGDAITHVTDDVDIQNGSGGEQ